MKLIVGLGNPGKKYDGTRHNTGFMCLDAIAEAFSVDITNKKFDGLYTKFKYHGEDIILLKPQTYMNNSGLSVIQTMKYFKIDVDEGKILKWPEKGIHLKLCIKVCDTGSYSFKKYYCPCRDKKL